MFSSSLSADGSGDLKVTPLRFFAFGVFFLLLLGVPVLLRSPRIRRGDLAFGVFAFGVVAALERALTCGDVADARLPGRSGVPEMPAPALPGLDRARRLDRKPVLGSTAVSALGTAARSDAPCVNDCGSEPR